MKQKKVVGSGIDKTYVGPSVMIPAGLPLLININIQSDVLFSNISAKEFPWNQKLFLSTSEYHYYYQGRK